MRTAVDFALQLHTRLAAQEKAMQTKDRHVGLKVEGDAMHRALHLRLRQRSAQAFCIIETLCALVVLAMFIGGACALALATRQITDMAREQYQAVTLAKNRLERVRTLPFDQLDLFEESQVRVNQCGVPDKKGGFMRTSTISTLDPDLKQVRVTVLVRNHLTTAFDGASEELVACIARYQMPVSQ